MLLYNRKVVKILETIGERLKYLRKDVLELNQTEFSERLKVSQSFFAQLEKNQRNLTDRTIADICREFNVNEEWLRYGTGEIFRETDEQVVDEFLKTHNLNEKALNIINNFIALSESERDLFIDVFNKIASGNTSNKSEPNLNEFTVVSKKDTSDETISVYKVARSENHNPPEMTTISKEKAELLKNAKGLSEFDEL